MRLCALHVGGVQQVNQRTGSAYDVLKRIFFVERAAQQTNFVDQTVAFNHTTNESSQFRRVNWLTDVIVSAALDRRDSALNGAVGGDYDNAGLRIFSTDPLQQIQTGDTREGSNP